MMRQGRRAFYRHVMLSDGCWLFMGPKNREGYGRVYVPGPPPRYVGAQRFAYELWVGPIPVGLQIDHLCREHACVRPDHMEAVTQRTNVLRGVGITARRAAQTHCIHGHPFDELNTYWRPNGHRDCRTCIAERLRRSKARRAA